MELYLSYAFTEVNGDDFAFYIWNYKAKPAYCTSETTTKSGSQSAFIPTIHFPNLSRAGVAYATENYAGKMATQMTTARQYNLQALITLRAVIKHYLLLLLVFSPWAGLGRDQSSVRRLVWLWYAASWASS